MNHKFLLLLPLCCVVWGCAETKPYPEDFIRRYTDLDTWAECLAIPIPGGRFTILENSIVFGQVYTGHYVDDYASYDLFLDALLNHPGKIDLCGTIGWCRNKKENPGLSRQADADFDRFLDQYMVRSGTEYTVKEEYFSMGDQIAKVCFDQGFYVHGQGCSSMEGEWQVSEEPLWNPPIPPDGMTREDPTDRSAVSG